MSSRLSRNSSIRRSFRLEITLEKKSVECSSPDTAPSFSKYLDSKQQPVSKDSATFKQTKRNWSSDPRLLSSSKPLQNGKCGSSGNLTHEDNGRCEKESKGSGQLRQNMQRTESLHRASQSQTIIQVTHKETVIEKRPLSELSPKERECLVVRSRPRSVGPNQRLNSRCRGSSPRREPSLSPTIERKPFDPEFDRSRTFERSNRLSFDGFVAKRCQAWERKSKEPTKDTSSYSHIDIDLNDSSSSQGSFINRRKAMLFSNKPAPDNPCPSTKQPLLDFSERTLKTTKIVSCQPVPPPKPQLKPKRVHLFNQGTPVKVSEVVSSKSVDAKKPEAADTETLKNFSKNRPVSSQKPNSNQSSTTMGKTCSVQESGSGLDEDYAIEAKDIYSDSIKNSHITSNGVYISNGDALKGYIKDKDRLLNNKQLKQDWKENNHILPVAQNLKNSKPISSQDVTLDLRKLSNTTEKVYINGEIPTGVLRERTIVDDNSSNVFEESHTNSEIHNNVEDVKEPGGDQEKEVKGVETPVNIYVNRMNGLIIRDEEDEKDGLYFLDVTNKSHAKLEALCKKAEIDLGKDLPEEVSGRLRATIGKATLLTTKKFKQFRRLCQENLNPVPDQPAPTCADLAGFWDMVMLQVDEINDMFEEIEVMRNNGWQSPKRQPPVKALDLKSPAGKIRPTKSKIKASTPKSSIDRSQKDAERTAKAKQQRDEARRRLLAAKKRMRQRTLSGSLSDEGGVEIFCPESSVK